MCVFVRSVRAIGVQVCVCVCVSVCVYMAIHTSTQREKEKGSRNYTDGDYYTVRASVVRECV